MPREDANLFDGDFLTRLEHVRLQMRKRFAGTLRAERRSRRTGSSLEFADFRNYVPGDDPRRIDWSIYGRIERLMMKLYEEEEDLDVGILIDCSASMHWRPQRRFALNRSSRWPGNWRRRWPILPSWARPCGAVVLRFHAARGKRPLPGQTGVSRCFALSARETHPAAEQIFPPVWNDLDAAGAGAAWRSS